MSNSVSSIRSFLKKNVVVAVSADLELFLSRPKAADVINIRESISSAAEGSPLNTLNILVECTKVCLPDADLDDEEIMQLILATGGEFGDLGRASAKMCGLDSLFKTVDNPKASEDA